MKKHIVILTTLAVALSFPAAVHAYDWAKQKAVVKSQEVKDEENRLTITDDAGLTFSLRYYGEVSDAHADIIIRMNKSFYTWKNMKPASVSFVITNDVVEANVIPQVLTYNKVSYLANVPSGLMFSWGDYMEYNFRISKNNYFVRVNDRFTTEEAMLDHIAEVVKNPKEYLKKREPDYLYKKIEKLEADNKKLTEELNVLKESHKRVTDALLEEHAKLTYAVLALHNTGFLGIGYDPIAKKKIDRVIEVKKANPTFKKKQIKELLEKEKLDVSKQEIELILNIYFNEFD